MSEEAISIRGCAHPAPPIDGSRSNFADLNAAEIATTNLANRPLLVEHDSGLRAGRCLASWRGVDGDLRVQAAVTDPQTIADVKSGKLRGLSLGTDVVLKADGGVLSRRQAELSLCEEGKRERTWISHVNDVPVLQHVACSKAATATSNLSAPRTRPPRTPSSRTCVLLARVPLPVPRRPLAIAA